MLKNLMWKMFQNTGNIEYFMQYKNIKENKPDFLTEAGLDNAWDGEKWHTSKQGEWSSEK